GERDGRRTCPVDIPCCGPVSSRRGRVAHQVAVRSPGMDTTYAALNGAYWLDDDLASCPDCVRMLDTLRRDDAGRARGDGDRLVTAVRRVVGGVTSAAHAALSALNPRAGRRRNP
ncbi:hypothetical protein NGM37_60975, partial [Streptomyces sp. TRM76130]|nr:hypothetical protein [Streptomyces sp. TRM76130]